MVCNSPQPPPLPPTEQTRVSAMPDHVKIAHRQSEPPPIGTTANRNQLSWALRAVPMAEIDGVAAEPASPWGSPGLIAVWVPSATDSVADGTQTAIKDRVRNGRLPRGTLIRSESQFGDVAGLSIGAESQFRAPRGPPIEANRQSARPPQRGEHQELVR